LVPIKILLIYMHAVDLFSSYKAIPILGNLSTTLGLLVSMPWVIPSLVQPMGVYHHSPQPYFIFYASSLVALIRHPPEPPLPSHPSTVYAPAFHPPPPPFPYASSIDVSKVNVSSEYVAKLSGPLANKSPLLLELFMVR
jgi:hypothetical protein